MTVFLVGSASSHCCASRLLWFFSQPDFLTSSISEGGSQSSCPRELSLNFPAQKMKRLHLENSLRLGWVSAGDIEVREGLEVV